MKKLIENTSLYFCDFDSNGSFKMSCAMRYFEKARFEVADTIGIYDCMHLEDGESVTFPVIKVSCQYPVPILLDDMDIQVVTMIQVPEGGIIRFQQSLVQDGQVKLYAVVDVAVLSNKHGVLYRLEDELIQRVQAYSEEEDTIVG